MTRKFFHSAIVVALLALSIGMLQEPATQQLPPELAQAYADSQRKEDIAKFLSEKYRQPYDIVKKYVELAWNHSQKHPDISPELVLAVIQKESSLQNGLISPTGAQGLMQVDPKWHGHLLDDGESLNDPKVNIRVGAQVLQQFIDKTGDLKKALQKYSGGARGYSDFVLRESKNLKNI